VPVAVLDVREDIKRGQVVSRYVIEGSNGGSWSELARGTTIGYRRLHRITPSTVSRLRLTIEDALAEPIGIALRAWKS
jgi:alpha-L-fucosidase